jgi:hypothetical protein
MDEVISWDAARKRFDKFKPVGSGKASKTKPNPEKDADLLKAVIKANGGVCGKGKAFWEVVAAAMEESITWDAARKRFDKFKLQYDNQIGPVGAVTDAKERRKTAKPKAAKHRKARTVKADEGIKEDELAEDAEDERSIHSAPKQKVSYTTTPLTQAELKSKVKMIRDWAENVSSESTGDEEFVVESPTRAKRGRVTKDEGRAAKRTKLEMGEENYKTLDSKRHIAFTAS